ncbi:MAG: hypothetical protein JWO75_5164, partial [Actinomycetia bacterium]|nr:hypothetical protein [Actinomycetes bacterium]
MTDAEVERMLNPEQPAETLEAKAVRLAAERGRFRSAWLNARYRAEGFGARYRYERKLCHDADVRGSKAIRAQLAAEADRDRLARKLDATVRVR